MSIQNYQLDEYLQTLLNVASYTDACPNGLQIEGDCDISRIITGVSLSQELIEHAIEKQAQAIIVHHGIFWNKEPLTILGLKKQRIQKLLGHGINLFAYHLPLDNHHELGNNIQLARNLAINPISYNKADDFIWQGTLVEAKTRLQFINMVEKVLKRKPQVFGGDSLLECHVGKIGWCTGGGQSLFNKAISLGVDVFLTGEVCEPIFDLAKESGVTYIAAGHYATERYGIYALGEHLKSKYQIEVDFVEIYNSI
jgi:dinuclear metal center YbgI/SA1388 family protein